MFNLKQTPVAVDLDKIKHGFLSIQASLSIIAKGIEDSLLEILKGQNHIDRVQSRVKGVESYVNKAVKKENGKLKYKVPLKEIQDLIGARIVVYYKSDVELVRDVIIKYFNSAEHIQVIPDNVMKFGYEGFHMLCFIPSTIYSDHKSNPLIPDFFELQIKTLYQHAWSQANHGLGYKPEAPLSFDEERKLAFIAAQSWGADEVLRQLNEGATSGAN